MNLKDIDIWLTNFLSNIGIFGYVLSCFCILIESILPFLPLSVFITLLFYKFGYLLGFIFSYIFTILGCLVSYKLFNSSIRNKLEKYIDKKDKVRLSKIMKSIKKIKFENLCLLIALPFTPAFLVNIAAGLVNMDIKKYFYSLLIGKTFLIIFWGFVGTSLINSLKNPLILFFIAVLLLICYIISRLVHKREGIE